MLDVVKLEYYVPFSSYNVNQMHLETKPRLSSDVSKI